MHLRVMQRVVRRAVGEFEAVGRRWNRWWSIARPRGRGSRPRSGRRRFHIRRRAELPPDGRTGAGRDTAGSPARHRLAGGDLLRKRRLERDFRLPREGAGRRHLRPAGGGRQRVRASPARGDEAGSRFRGAPDADRRAGKRWPPGARVAPMNQGPAPRAATARRPGRSGRAGWRDGPPVRRIRLGGPSARPAARLAGRDADRGGGGADLAVSHGAVVGPARSVS